MNPKYLKDLMAKKLEESKNLFKIAIDLKASNKELSTLFESVSKSEFDNAENVYKVFMNQDFSDYQKHGSYISSIKDCATDLYTKGKTELEKLHEAYDVINSKSSKSAAK